MRAAHLVLLMCLAALPGGCGLFKTEIDKCHELREYQKSRTGERAQVPDDLEALPEDTWVPVPAGATNTEATPKEQPCLIEPPDYLRN